MIIIKWLVLISGERVLREFGSCRWKVGWRWSGWTFCALDHDRFFEASLFGHLLAFLVRNHLTFVVKFRFAMSGHFGYVKGMTGTKSSRFTSNIVDVLLDLLLLWPLFHLTMTFFELTAFIFIDLKKKKSKKFKKLSKKIKNKKIRLKVSIYRARQNCQNWTNFILIFLK